MRLKNQTVNQKGKEMIDRFLNGKKQHSRLLILIFKHPVDGYCVLVHDNQAHFTLDRKEHVMTAAFERLRPYFQAICTADIHYYGNKQHFQKDGLEYHPVVFEIPMIGEDDNQGIRELKKSGFRFCPLKDYFFCKQIGKVIPSLVD